jgi:type III pantothenate kinase
MVSLCFDIGNTVIKAAVFDNNRELLFRTIDQGEFSVVPGIIEKNHVQAAIISSVSVIPEELTKILITHLRHVIVLSHNTKVPIENCYETRETLGKDRLAAVAGANYLYPDSDLLVIDAGTAITYDIVNRGGQYLGGNIAPGIRMRFKALHHFTSKLPLVDVEDNFPLYGTNTHDAILSGVLQGIICEVDGTIDRFRQLYPNLKVLFTGGNAKFFDGKLKNVIFVVENLVMIGLHRILEYNAQNT